jgi:hypothetical protein
MSIRDQILGANDRVREPIDLPAWGSPAVFVTVMSGTDRDAFEASIVSGKGKDVTQNLENVRAKLAVRCLVDADGARVFSDADAQLLGQKSAAELQKVFDVARKLNRLSDTDIDELAKNSSGDLNAASISG